jgi:hypothetical protein
MTGIRRYSTMKAIAGTRWDPDVRAEIMALDGGRCVGPRAGLPDSTCDLSLEIDHVRASHGMGMKSRSTVDNGVVLCGRHHRIKTEHGKLYRPLLLDWIARRSGDCGHVDVVSQCSSCRRRLDPGILTA